MKHIWLIPVIGAVASAQVVVSDGTKVRLRLDQSLSSATAEEGQTVELSAADSVKVDGFTVIPEGSRATGTVVVAQEKRRMGRAGKLDFSVDRVRTAQGEWLPVRYTLTKKTGNSKAVSTGVITAGVAVVFWPAAPFVLLRKGKDTQLNKGITFDVFIDGNHTIGAAPAPPALVTSAPQPARPAAPETGLVPVSTAGNAFAPMPPPAAPAAVATSADQATVTINSTDPGADIEINGIFVGNTPTKVKLAPGQYAVAVSRGTQIWRRTLQVSAGSAITLNAEFEMSQLSIVQRRR